MSDSLVSSLSNWVDDDVKKREDKGIFTEENKECLRYDTHEMTMRPPGCYINRYISQEVRGKVRTRGTNVPSNVGLKMVF